MTRHRGWELAGCLKWNGFSVFQDQRCEFLAAGTGGGTPWLAPGVPRALGSLPGHPALPAARVPQVGTAQAAAAALSKGDAPGKSSWRGLSDPGFAIPWGNWAGDLQGRLQKVLPAKKFIGSCQSCGTVTVPWQGNIPDPSPGHFLFSRSVTQQKGVDLRDVQVSAGQQFLQVRPRQGGNLEDMWQVRAVPVPLGSRQMPAPAWQVFAGIVARSSVGPEAGVPIREIIPHPLYNDSSLDYDIALMRLRVPLNFSGAIRAACLPPSPQDLLQGTQCWVSGWGYTTPGQAQVAGTLKEALVPLIGTRRCNSSCMYK
ncbi:hypothetical protein Nmel_017279, partial [Mimus melanotis]